MMLLSLLYEDLLITWSLDLEYTCHNFFYRYLVTIIKLCIVLSYRDLWLYSHVSPLAYWSWNSITSFWCSYYSTSVAWVYIPSIAKAFTCKYRHVTGDKCGICCMMTIMLSHSLHVTRRCHMILFLLILSRTLVNVAHAQSHF